MSFGFGGGDNKQYNLNLRKAFADTPDSRFESYVDSRGDLANAWRMIDTYQKGGDMSGFAMHGNMTPAEQAQYWIRKAEGGRFNKADFGRFHAAEDKSLLEGNYPGGTEVRKGTDAYDKYFPEGTTRFDQFSSEGAGESGGEGGGGGGGGSGGGNPLPELGPYPTPNVYFPILETEYNPPVAQDWSQYMPVGGLLSGGAQARYPRAYFPPLDDDGRVLPQTPSEPITGGQQFDIPGLLYQPWTTEYQQAFVPGNIWQYDPNQFGVGQVKYIDNPFGSLQLPEDWEDLLGPFDEDEEEEEESNSDIEQRGI